MNTAEKSLALYKIVCAFGKFAGRPVTALDAASVLSEVQLATMDIALRQIAVSLRAQDSLPSLKSLGDEILESLGEVQS